MILAILAVVSASFQPPSPKVGDLITVTFAAPVVLDASPDFEVISHNARTVVVRTFEPRPFVLSGTIGPIPSRDRPQFVRFRNLRVPVASVLAGGDLTPAPLAPPRRAVFPELPWIIAAVLVLLALVAWLLWRRVRSGRSSPAGATEHALTPEERFRRAVLALRESPSQPLRWARLADETRTYLAATRPRFSSDLTTTELVPRLVEQERIVAEVLRQGDLEKFSLHGASGCDFDEVADEVLRVAATDAAAGAARLAAGEPRS